MELDELKLAWADLGRRVDEKDAHIRDLLRGNALSGLRSRLRLTTRRQWIQLILGLLLAVWGGSTWVDHWGTWHVVAYGLGLHAYGIALLATAALQLARLAAIDYAGPIAPIQQSLLRLRQARMRSERILIVAGGIGWVPVLFLLLYQAGFDAWATRPANVLANLGVGTAISAALLWASVRCPAWFQRRVRDEDLDAIERELREMDDG